MTLTCLSLNTYIVIVCVGLCVVEMMVIILSRFANPGGIKGEEGTPGYMAPEAIRRRGEDQAFDEKVNSYYNVNTI